MSLKDIAKEAGVSISTVSRVLNNSSTSSASKELQAKIWEIAKQQNYVPNEAARRLKNKPAHPSEAPRFLYCMYACSPQEVTDDPFFPTLMETIEREAFKHNFFLQYTFTSSVIDPAALSIRLNHSDKHSNNLILIGRFKKDLYLKLKPYFKNIIYIGLNELDVPCDQVICNGYNIASDGVRYFSELGHKNIGFIGCKEARYNGYLHALESCNIPQNESSIISDAVLSMNGGYRGMLRLLEQSKDVTAVFCANDMVSIGALRACNEKGIRVPENISLLGIDDIENIQYTKPMLSSIHVPLEEMGKTAVSILLSRMNGSHKENIKVFFPHRIVRRESCQKI